MLKTILIVVAICLVIYCTAISFLYFRQESLIFAGDKLPADYQFQFDQPFEEVNIDVDGASLNALHFQQENPRGLVFFLHGNAGNLVDWTENVDFYRRVNYDLFIFDYRGYGKSTGKITSQEQLLSDVRKAWDSVSHRYADKPIVIYGRSLGSGLAVQLAKDVNPAMVTLISPFRNLTSIALSQYPYVPKQLLRYPLATDKIIADLKSDIVFIHGDKDTLIPIEHSHDLNKLLNKPAKVFVIEGSGHGDIHQFDSYLKALEEVLPN
jgi:pimeloyl-ACP methyl ester carboxylesterase